MTRIKFATAALAALLATGAAIPAAASSAGRITVMQSSLAPITLGATYAWGSAWTASNDPRVDNMIFDERMRQAVDLALAAKGMRRVADPALAQFVVSYRIAVEQHAEAHVNHYVAPVAACGFRGCVHGWAYAAPTVDVNRYAQGALVLDLSDRVTGRLVWRATADKRVSQKDVSQARLNAAVADLTRSLP